MERCVRCGCVVLAIVLISLNVTFAQPMAGVNDAETKLPPLIFPKENVTIGTGLPPVIFPKENVTVGEVPATEINTVTTTTSNQSGDVPPLIFPKTNGSIPVVELPPLIFPDNNKTFTVIPPTNETALKILNTNGSNKPVLPDSFLDDDYYSEDSSETDPSEEVEEIQPIDKNPQTDDLEENYKSEMHLLPLAPSNDFTDSTEVDHPMLRNTHILGIIGAVLAVLCVCIYLGITVWRRIMFNRYGMRERLINEDDFYTNKSIHHNF